MGTKKTTPKTSILTDLISLKSAVDSMSDFKNESSKRGQEIYSDYKKRIPVMMKKLKEKGVTEQTHPMFRDAVIAYNYWK